MKKSIERIQAGVRLEKRLLKVRKGLAEHLDISVAELIEGMSLLCFESKPPFSGKTPRKIERLKAVCDLDLDALDSHNLQETGEKR